MANHVVTPPEGRARFIRETKEITVPFFEVVSAHQSTGNTLSKYTHLTERQYLAFMSSYRGEGSVDHKVRFGFKVLGNLIGQMPIAYADYLAQTEETADYTEFTQTLHASFGGIVKPVARLDNDRAVCYENWLGLSRGTEPFGTSTGYRFVRRQDQLVVEPKLDNLDAADEEVAVINRSQGHEVDPKRGCPALKFVLPVLWGINIEGCANDPAYFQSDIDELTKAAHSKVTA